MSGYVDDEMLIRRAQAGDAAAFNALVDKHMDRAYRYAFRLTRDEEDAADVAAEAFVRVFNAIHNFRSQSTFTTWLYRIVTNCFLDQKKRDKTKHNVSLDTTFANDDDSVGRQIEDDGPTPLELAEDAERKTRLDAAIQKLPDYQRALVVMYHSEGLSYDQIAESLDMPVGTVKSRLNRARLVLRDLLSRNQELFQV